MLTFLFNKDKESHSKQKLVKRLNALKSQYDSMLLGLNNKPPSDFKKGYKDLMVVGSHLGAVEAQLKKF